VVSVIALAAIVVAAALVLRKVVLGLIVAAFAPIPVRGNLKVRGELGKSWFAAGALEVLDSITIAFAAAHGIQPFVQVYLFDHKLLHRSITPRMQKKFVERMHDELLHDKDGFIGKLARWRDKVQRWFDWKALRAFALRIDRFIRVDRFEGELVYSLSDFAWTGMTLGVLYTIAGLLSPVGSFRVEPKWEEVTRGQGRVEIDLHVLPVRFLLSALAFTVKNIKLRKPKPPKAPPARTLHMEAQHGR